ncbi:C-GCAxxG-C-C family (seleno)protein, partial [Fibrobacterota bacterium]
LAGGMGLCGGACGALGAAVWIMGMGMVDDPNIKNLWSDKVFKARFAEVVDGFLKKTDYKFECSEIVGRKFEDIKAHADYVGEGGCSELIETIADLGKKAGQ